ncbi:MAG: hypothetical protein IPM16_23040 [Chloroflexi bacterium]|nr:hypothetical protein [Chloroflexota bacterium]
MTRLTRFLILAVGMSALLPTARAQDILEFPPLTGEYQVGRTAYHLIDHDRKETFTTRPDDVRELMIIVYYPAAPSADDQSAPYLEGLRRECLSTGNRRIGPFDWDRIVSHAYTNVPVSDRRKAYPVLLFSPGFTTNPVFYTAMLEEITSHGYVVVALTHPYSTDAVAFSNGRVINLNASGTRLMTVLSSDPEYGEQIGDHTLDVWASDALFALDQLQAMNRDDPLLSGRMDLDHVGMFGHSFGGATSAEAASRDDRILAATNMDGAFFGTVDDTGLDQPFMFMASDHSWPKRDEDRFGMSEEDWNAMYDGVYTDLEKVCEHASNAYAFTLDGSSHGTYTDLALLATMGVNSWIFEPMFVGHINAVRAHQVITTYVVAFFDKHVRGLDVPLLDGPSIDYPEVTLDIDA